MRKPLVYLAIVALVSLLAPALLLQATAQQQGNAASATKDNSGTTGDQITNPPGAKGSTLIGCLSGPDKDGKYTLRSMTYRTGVEVLGGGDELKNDSGTKVKLTGKWEAPQADAATQEKANHAASDKSKPAEMRRFQVTDVEVMAKTCSVPAEVTPQSKNKRGKTTIYNAPSSDNTH
jgi:hypothetical protein